MTTPGNTLIGSQLVEVHDPERGTIVGTRFTLSRRQDPSQLHLIHLDQTTRMVGATDPHDASHQLIASGAADEMYHAFRQYITGLSATVFPPMQYDPDAPPGGTLQ